MGGKTGVNLPEGKNLVGAFHQPRLVVCDPLTLGSLPRREIRCGLAEALKHGFIADGMYLAQVQSLSEHALSADPAALGEIVAGSCRIKARLSRLMSARRDSGRPSTSVTPLVTLSRGRRLPPYRHVRLWPSVWSGRQWSVLAWASRRSVVDHVRAAMGQWASPPPRRALDADELLQAISHDKKTERGRVRWVLPIDVGKGYRDARSAPRTVVRVHGAGWVARHG